MHPAPGSSLALRRSKRAVSESSLALGISTHAVAGSTCAVARSTGGLATIKSCTRTNQRMHAPNGRVDAAGQPLHSPDRRMHCSHSTRAVIRINACIPINACVQSFDISGPFTRSTLRAAQSTVAVRDLHVLISQLHVPMPRRQRSATRTR